MKLRAKQANFEFKMEETLKLNKEKVLFEKLTGVAKAKRMALRKIGWGKQLRQQLRAFTALK